MSRLDASAATVPVAPLGADGRRLASTGSAVLWALAGLTGLGLAVRFSTLGLQSYHHDEVITVARVIPGSFAQMLDEVRRSESNPPLYYVVAWAWSKAFGTGEIGMRSLSALLGTATIPFAFLAAREAVGARAGLVCAAIVAVDPMLIWYSQEARSYAMLVFFCAVSLYFFLRARRGGAGSDLAFWALSSGAALCSHYFAVFAVAVEAAWLLVALRSRLRTVVPAIAGVALVGAALLPLIAAQVNPAHIGWIDETPLSSRFLQTGVSFLAGETGHVIAEPPRERYALAPAALIGVALLLLALRGSGRERRGALAPLAVGLGVAAPAAAAALAGSDYVVERNLLPALVPLAVVAAIGFSARGARRLGLVCATLLCAYWLGYAVVVARTANLQRPDFRELVEKLGPPTRPRAIVGWKLAADPVRFYLHDHAERLYRGTIPLREIDVVGKPVAKRLPVRLPPTFHQVERIRLERLTLIRYTSRSIVEVPYDLLRDLPTGFGSNGVVVDSPESARLGGSNRRPPPSRSRPCRRCMAAVRGRGGGGSESW
jgi:mannosyltransferase